MNSYGRLVGKAPSRQGSNMAAVGKKEFFELRALLVAASFLLALFAVMNLFVANSIPGVQASRSVAGQFLTKGAIPILFLCILSALRAASATYEACGPHGQLPSGISLQPCHEMPDPVLTDRKALRDIRVCLFLLAALLAATAWFMISMAVSVPYLRYLAPVADLLFNRSPWLLMFLCFLCCFRSATITVKK